MTFGTQISTDRTNKANATEQALWLRDQAGCIRSGVKYCPVSFAYPNHNTDYYAYGVFADDCGENPVAEGVRRVILIGADERAAARLKPAENPILRR